MVWEAISQICVAHTSREYPVPRLLQTQGTKEKSCRHCEEWCPRFSTGPFESVSKIPLSANWSTEQDAKQSLSTNGCCGLWLALRPRWPGPASQEAGCCSRCGQPWHITGYLSASRPGWARSPDGRLPAVRLQMSPGLGGNPITWHSSFLLTWQQTCMENVRLPLFLYGPLGSHNNF